MQKRIKKPAEYEDKVLCDGCGLDVTKRTNDFHYSFPNLNFSNPGGAADLPDLCALCNDEVLKAYKKSPFKITLTFNWKCNNCDEVQTHRDVKGYEKCDPCLKDIAQSKQSGASYPMLRL